MFLYLYLPFFKNKQITKQKERNIVLEKRSLQYGKNTILNLLLLAQISEFSCKPTITFTVFWYV